MIMMMMMLMMMAMVMIDMDYDDHVYVDDDDDDHHHHHLMRIIINHHLMMICINHHHDCYVDVDEHDDDVLYCLSVFEYSCVHIPLVMKMTIMTIMMLMVLILINIKIALSLYKIRSYFCSQFFQRHSPESKLKCNKAWILFSGTYFISK